MALSSTGSPSPQADPPLPGLTDLGPLLAAFAVGALLAVLLGLFFAEALRRRNRNWTWALLTLVPCTLVAACALAAGFAYTPAAFAFGLTVGLPLIIVAWGLHRRIEDHRAGGDRATAAREMRGVLDSVRRRIAERRSLTAASLSGGIPVGRTHRGWLATIRRGTADSGSHALIPGATGAGKTTSLAALLADYVCRSGFGAVVLEAKTDDCLADTARAAAASRGVPFRLISPEGPSSYDPLANGSVDERSERLIAVEAWGSADADFYRQAASPFLRLVIRALDAADTRATLRSVAEACDPDRLENLAGRLDDEDLTEEILAFTQAIRADERRAVSGLRARLVNLAHSEFARKWLDPDRVVPNPASDQPQGKGRGGAVDLAASIRAREVLYFRFDSDRTGNVGRAIAQMVLLDLGATASSLIGRGPGTFVAIDEFGALEASALDRLYTRGRSAGMSVAVGTQTVADLREAGPAVRERIGGTIESIVCHRIGNQADAEWIAQLIGTVPTWDTTTRTDALGLPTDKGTRTRGYRFEVHPSQLQRLAPGEAYVARLDDQRADRASRVRVVPAWERLPAGALAR